MVLRYFMKKSVLLVFLCLIAVTLGCCGSDKCGCKNCKCGNKPLSTKELMERFGQDGTEYNDGRSCYRACDGNAKVCYYEFMPQTYDTMSGLCGNCREGNLTDCNNPGCIPTNGLERVVFTYNRQIPGPAIHVCKGDRIIVDVMNHLPGDETVIHWHGILQQKTPWMDGVQMVTQCPIPQGTTFRYDYEATDAGTFWYHSHSGVQRTDGLFGSLIIHDDDDANKKYYDCDYAEHTILVTDWINVLASYYTPGVRSNIIHPDSILINGHGTYQDPKTGNNTFAPIAVFYVPRGKRCLFRLINTGSQNCPSEFSIEGLKLTVTASDSYSICPVTVDRIVFQPGERYDFVINAPKKRSITERLIRVRALGGCAAAKLQEFARIVFVDDYNTHKPRVEDQAPLTKRPTYESLEDPNASYLNHPQTNCADPKSKSYCVAALEQKRIAYPTGGNLRDDEIEDRIYLEFRNSLGNRRPSEYLTIAEFALVSMVNNISMSHPTCPVLTQDDTNQNYCNAQHLPKGCDPQTICNCIHLIPLKLCKVYEFQLYDSGEPGGVISHPFHLHGYGFQVCDMGTMEQLANRTTPYPKSKRLPPVKDVISIPSGGFVRIRFKSCNPGFWLFHCHFEFHMHTGMMALIKVGEKSDMVPPPPGFPKCGDYLPWVKVTPDQLKNSPPRKMDDMDDMDHTGNTDPQGQPYVEVPMDHSMH